MPALFVGHGSPMNAIEDTAWSRAWSLLGQSLPRPEAVLCVSAHWETRGARVTAMARPRTIHDFSGFPPELHRYHYPALGSPELATRVSQLASTVAIGPDAGWGLDHGAWSVLGRIFPAADVPVVQLSLDRTLTPQQHYDLGRELRPLRDEGVLVLGSGNIVHNLATMTWEDVAFAWAVEFDAAAARWITDADHASLVDVASHGRHASLAINSGEHYLPLLYVLALQDLGETADFFTTGVTLGSVSMRSLRVG